MSRTLTAEEVSAGYVDFTVVATDLGADGLKRLTAVITDAAGNTSLPSAELSFTLDTRAPTAPVLTEQGSNDLGDPWMSAAEAISTTFRIDLPQTGSKAVADDRVELLLGGQAKKSLKLSQ